MSRHRSSPIPLRNTSPLVASASPKPCLFRYASRSKPTNQPNHDTTTPDSNPRRQAYCLHQPDRVPRSSRTRTRFLFDPLQIHRKPEPSGSLLPEPEHRQRLQETPIRSVIQQANPCPIHLLTMSAIQRDHATCLPPAAYIRIIQSSHTDTAPKFRSSVYPKPKPETKTKKVK